MRMTTCVDGNYTPRDRIKQRTPVAAKRARLVCELSRLEDSDQADSEHARTLKAKIALCDELLVGPCG